jgi:hypothetical protein
MDPVQRHPAAIAVLIEPNPLAPIDIELLPVERGP